MTDKIDRCRLVLVTPDIADTAELARLTGDALRGGDVASVIIPQHDLDEKSFQKRCEALVPVIQAAGAAALVAGDSRVAGRVRTDGLHIEAGPTAMAEAVQKYAPGLIVGGGNARERHSALSIGEAQPDYVIFGSINGDIKPEPHSQEHCAGGMVGRHDRDPLPVDGRDEHRVRGRDGANQSRIHRLFQSCFR
jgi:thiamine-phosphate pyrophosphorylase